MSENQRQKQKNATRKHLIEVAMKLFGRNGILTTKTAEIAKTAGVSHGTVFAHFSTQEELLLAVIEEVGARINSRLDELLDINSSLKEILKAHLKGLSEFEEFYTRLVTERRLLPESVSNTYVMIQTTISFHISIAAEREINQGIMREIPIHLIYNTWISLIHYYLTNSDLFSSDGSVLTQYGDELLDHYMSLISV